jgi:hypothetical protein
MNLTILDECLEAFQRAKKELLRIESIKNILADLDAAYANLTRSEKAIRRLLGPTGQ